MTDDQPGDVLHIGPVRYIVLARHLVKRTNAKGQDFEYVVLHCEEVS